MSRHSVFVLDVNEHPLAPTTPTRARKLLRSKVAKPVWSKFGTFGIQMLVNTRKNIPDSSIGVDPGSKYDGYAVVVGSENNLAIKLNLPDKDKIVKKIVKRRILRRLRRYRKCRRRVAKFNNRKKDSKWLAPSQKALIQSKLKVLRALFSIYPIARCALEDVRFNHRKHKWGRNFSTVETGKAVLREFLRNKSEVFEYQGFQTKFLRESYGYKKVGDRSKNCFESHCSDALALACNISLGKRIEPGKFLTVDDSYRPIRRQLFDCVPVTGGVHRKRYQTAFDLRNGVLICSKNGKIGRLCGKNQGYYRYYDKNGKRQVTKTLSWISRKFFIV